MALKIFRGDPAVNKGKTITTFLKVPAPLPPLTGDQSSLNSARLSLWVQLRDACSEEFNRTVTPMESFAVDAMKDVAGGFVFVQPNRELLAPPSWSVDQCTGSLLDQLEERVALLCENTDKHRTRTEKATPRNNHAAPSLSVATACLSLSTPSLELKYPSDAASHFLEIERALRPWSQRRPKHTFHSAAGFNGPWFENDAVDWFTSEAHRVLKDGLPLSVAFGPYIPILLPWTDLWAPERYA